MNGRNFVAFKHCYDSNLKIMTCSDNPYRDGVRIFILKNAPALVFLGAYFLTVVLANLVFASPFGLQVLKAAGYPTDMLYFKTSFTLGYFALLLLPFLIVPPVAWAARAVGYRAKPWLLRVPDIGRLEFAVAFILGTGYVAGVIWQGGIVSYFAQGKDAISSVEARFLILKAFGTKTLIVLHSILWFLAVYALIRALRTREQFWIGFAVFSFVVVAVGLTLLNMKWPILIFFSALILALFAYSRRPYAAVSVGVVFFVFAYIAVTAFSLRISSEKSFTIYTEQVREAMQSTAVPVPSPAVPVPSPAVPVPSAAPSGYLSALSGSALVFVTNPFLRMAGSYPYYYKVFTEEGPICGGPFSQVLPDPPCVPTWLIYTRVYPNDIQFAGRGTSPAAVHVTGYALGGWPVAIIELILVAIILGLCASLPLQGSSTLGALFVTGTVVGYHWSQVPGEGPIIYDYGVLWSMIALAVLLAATQVRRRFF